MKFPRLKVPWKCHESSMKVTWNWHETIIIFFQDWKPYEIDMNLPWICHETTLKVTWIWYEYDTVNEVRQFSKFRESATNYQTYMKLSCQIHRGFMSLSFKPNKSKSCQIHGSFMAVSCQFHGTFTSKPDLGTVCQCVLKKEIHKIVFTCRFAFFCDVLVSFFVICQIHVGFMALSWHFHAGFYIRIFKLISFKKI